MNAHGGVVLAMDLVAGGTVLLGLGTVLVLLSRAPVHRQRAAELAVLGTMVWLALALAPLPRLTRQPTSTDVASSRALLAAGSPSADAADVETSFATAPTLATGAQGGALLPRPRELQLVDDTRDDPMSARLSTRAPSVTTVIVPLWLRVAFAIYVFGAVAVLVHVLLGAFLVRRLVVRAALPAAWLADLFEARRRTLGVRRCRLRVTSASRRPLSAGITDPAVLLPAALVDPTRRDELRCVIDHELVHVARADVASRSLMAYAAAVLWPHPLFWFLRSRALLAAELIADDAAAGAIGRNAYARMLMSLAEELHALKPAPGLVPGTYRQPTELTRRIEMLISRHDRLATRWSPARRTVHVTAALAAVAVCTLAFGVRPGVAAMSGGHVLDASDSDAALRVTAVQQARPPQQTRVQQQSQGEQQSRGQQTAQPRQQRVGQHTAQPRQQPNGQQSPQPQQQPRGRQEPQRVQQRQQDVDAFYAETLALVERAIELKSHLIFEGESFEDAQRKHAAGALDEVSLSAARAALESTQRTLQAVLILVESEIEATQLEMADIEKRIQLGQLDSSARAQQIRLQGRMKALQSVL